MRVAVVESAPRGGLLHYAAQLSEGLARRGNDVELVTARVHELGAGPAGVRMRAVLPAAVRTPTEAPTGVRYLLRRVGILVRLVRASGRTLLEVARGRYDAVLLVDDLSVAPAAAGALLLTLLPGAPRLGAVCHEPRPRSRRAGGDLYATSRPLLAALGRLYPRLDVVFVHGERSRQEFVRTWPPAHVVVIPHGDERLLAGDPPPPASEERILFFGEWRRAKGLHELMGAFDLLAARRPEARLTIAGVPAPDADPDAVRDWAARQGERVTLIDRYVPIAEVRGVFAGARVVAAPYLAGSQSGVVHLAMTMARPVVASDAGELPESVLDGVTGRIVSRGDTAALCAALEEILSDPALAERLGTAGRRRVMEEFGWERVAERVDRALRAGAQASGRGCR
jgi:glycosyltransferase involved in cell wall biosynthesis